MASNQFLHNEIGIMTYLGNSQKVIIPMGNSAKDSLSNEKIYAIPSQDLPRPRDCYAA